MIYIGYLAIIYIYSKYTKNKWKIKVNIFYTWFYVFNF